MSIIDYLIIIIPTCFIMGAGWYMRRYIRGVVDFLSAGRICGRYIISVASVASGLSVLGAVAYVEVHYKTGFALTFWNSLMLPLSVIMGLTGFFFYRFRETKAMSLGQFLEMRYSRAFRIFAAALRSMSEMFANMIMPAIAARFFIYFLDLPEKIALGGWEIPTFQVVIGISLVLAISIICMGGMLGIVITDSFQGFLLYPLLVFFIVFLLWKFSWSSEIAPVMLDRVPEESFLDPYDIRNLRDFNLFFLGVTLFATVLHRGSWITGSAGNARSPHEQKMSGLLGDWRGALNTLFYVLIAASILTMLNHRNFAREAKEIRSDICERVAREIAPDAEVRGNLITATKALPAHNHRIGIDKPLSEKNNLDTPYLETARRELAKGENGNALFQQFRTLYHQVMLAITMRHMLPTGALGLFCLLMILAMISTDDTRIFSAASTIAQDVVLPLRKKPFTPEQHVWMIRWVSIGIGVFFFIGSSFMSQLDYIDLFMRLMTIMWMGGCGPVMLFGLYSRFGNTWGAWTSLLAGMFMGVVSIVLQRNWADTIYPVLLDRGWAEPLGDFLAAVSKPFHPYVVWTMNPVKCPINSYELYFITMVLTLFLYISVSWITGRGREKFNLDRMLHRGIYSVDGEKKPVPMKWSFGNVLGKMVGITSEYTAGDKVIAWMFFFYSVVYKFGIIFVLVIVWNCFSAWSARAWSNYFLVVTLIVPGILAAVTTVWFGIGGVRDMIRLFRDLKSRTDVNVLDDGRVEGHVSLADKAAMDEADRKKVAE